MRHRQSSTLVAPREDADQPALVEHHRNAAAEVFRVQQPCLGAELCNGNTSAETLRPERLCTYTKVQKNSPAILPRFIVNSSTRPGRIWRTDVFITSAGHGVAAPPLIIQESVFKLGPGWQQKGSAVHHSSFTLCDE